MIIRRPVLLSCLLLLPAAAAAAVHGVPPPFSAMPGAQAAPAGQSGEGATAAVDRGPARSVVVVPFSNISRDAADDWIGDGIAETVAADLESLGTMVVIGRDAAAATRLGRDLGVGWVVTGGYQRVGQRLRITARLGRRADRSGRRDSYHGRDPRRDLRPPGPDRDRPDHDDRAQWNQNAALRGGTGLRRRQPERRERPDRRGAGAGNVASNGGRVLSRGGRGALARPGRGTVSGGIVLPGSNGADLGRGPGDGSVGGGPGARGGAPTAAVSAGILTGRPSVTATFANEPPRIDGQLDDAIWQGAAVITEFVQRSPIEGAPATEDTEV